MEAQPGFSFSDSYDLAPRPPPNPLPPPVSKLDQRHSGRLREREKLLKVEVGEGGGRGAESYNRKKVCLLYETFNTLC
jgi:hypothetical protein